MSRTDSCDSWGSTVERYEFAAYKACYEYICAEPQMTPSRRKASMSAGG
jgi:hypothetical protein